MTAAAKKTMLDSMASTAVVMSVYNKTQAEAVAMDDSDRMTLINKAVTGPKWGNSGKPWCMGMPKTPITGSTIFAAATLTSHPNAVGTNKGFHKCWDVWINGPHLTYGGTSTLHKYPTCAEAKEDPNAAKSTIYPMKYSSQLLLATGLNKGTKFVQLIKEVRAALKVSDPKTIGKPGDFTDSDLFPTGIPFIFWEQYVDLSSQLQNKLTYALLVALFAMALLIFVLAPMETGAMNHMLASVWGASIVVVLCMATVAEVYGFMGIIGIKLNAIPQVTLIMTMGIAVEFTAHTVLAFICTSSPANAEYIGSRQHRCRKALEKMGPPTVHGSVTTFLGIVMITMSPTKFLVVYYFVLYALIVLFGSINGLVALPAILVVAGPPSTSVGGAGKVVSMIQVSRSAVAPQSMTSS